MSSTLDILSNMLYTTRMKEKSYQRLRAVIVLFVGLLVAVATTLDNSFLLASAAILVGMLFMGIVRAKNPHRIDEREVALREKAANLTYAVFAPTLGIGSFLLLILTREEFLYPEAIGQVMAYLTLFLITLYALFYAYLTRKY